MFGDRRSTLPPGALLAWTGDFDPGIEGHGTLTASNVVGQAVINGNAPTFTDLPGEDATRARSSAARRRPSSRRTATSTSPSTSRPSSATCSATEHGVDVTSNSYGNSDVDNDGYDAASQEADIIHERHGGTTPRVLDRQRRPGLRHDDRRRPRRSASSVGASTQFGGDRLGLDRPRTARSPTTSHRVVQPRPGRDRRPGVDIVADGAYSAGDPTLNTVLDGRVAWETWGGTSRSTPVAAGATALVYQAYRKSPRRPVRAGFCAHGEEHPEVLGARTSATTRFTQGAGSLDAGPAR